MSSNTSDITKEGCTAFLKGERRVANPYEDIQEEGYYDHDNWISGWEEAQSDSIADVEYNAHQY